MDAKEELEALLRASGAKLKRKSNHVVWELPDGRKFTHALTPSDVRAWPNALATLRKMLGIRREVAKSSRRRSKPGAPKPVWKPTPPPAPLRKTKGIEALERLYARLAFKPKPCCVPVDLRPVPMTPVWCILRNLLGYGGSVAEVEPRSHPGPHSL